jgi:hypothetical protein
MKNTLTLLIICLSYCITNAQTTITLQPGSNGKDASIWGVGTNDNFPDRHSLHAYTWSNSGTLSVVRSLIEFDFSSIPSNATITSAELSLYFNPNDSFNFANHSGDNVLYIQQALSAWTETGVTWNNQPTTTTANQVIMPSAGTSTQDYLNIDVSAMVTDMFSSPSGNNGFLLRMENETSFYRAVVFASSDHPNANLRPKLVITYEVNVDSCVTLKPNGAAGKDASVWGVGTNDNFPNRHSLHAYTWSNSGTLSVVRSLIEFDFSSIPSNATITSAELSLYFNPNDSFSFANHSGDNVLYIQRALSAWTETGVTWNNQPTITTANQVTMPSVGTSTQDYLNIDVSGIVSDMFSSPSGNNGFLLRMENETSFYRAVVFASSDHPNANLHPEISVCWQVISSSNSINKQDYDLNFTVYPNPTNNLLNITTTLQGNNETQYQIINTLGATAMANKATAKDFSIDVSAMPAGIYFIHLQSGNAKTVKRFVKE